MSTATPDIGAQAYGWWRTLNPENGPINRGALARLRRADDPVELAFIDEAAKLSRRLQADTPEAMMKAARIAHLLAHVRDNAFPKVARALGPQSGDESAVMSEARFRRLLQARDDEDLDRRLIRAVKMLKGTVNVADLANAVWWWNERTRRDWAFNYFNAPLPEADSVSNAA
ncbi:MAG: type I-E CRISPR-associated protein Cse2/CasB [Alphaproteobacteria bacterium]|nr:type I-E CRISPR-associated protein Cse2/CasB [Alphaproteobacteria bacterium]